jgi:cell division protein ZapB
VTASNDLQAQVQQLAARLDRVLELARRLADENRSLRAGQEQLVNERAQLLSKNEMARSRVESMISRLKSLENNA